MPDRLSTLRRLSLSTIPSSRFAEALAFTESLHRHQRRKGKATPYIAHLLGVCSTVLEWGGDEDVAIAALLHDAVEDQGGRETAEEIRNVFGESVAELVLECSDSLEPVETAKAPWLERKEAYLAGIGGKSDGAALITAADKLYNAKAILLDLRAEGPSTLRRFNSPDRVAWYYHAVLKALSERASPPPLAELEAAVAGILELAPSSVEAPHEEAR
jgi:(p)ppGpp synthase/HD superfamily hydrolase